MYQPLLANRYLSSRLIPLIAVAAVGLLGNLAGWPWTPSWTHYAVPVTLVLLRGVIAISISFWLAIGHSIDVTSDEP